MLKQNWCSKKHAVTNFARLTYLNLYWRGLFLQSGAGIPPHQDTNDVIWSHTDPLSSWLSLPSPHTLPHPNPPPPNNPTNNNVLVDCKHDTLAHEHYHHTKFSYKRLSSSYLLHGQSLEGTQTAIPVCLLMTLLQAIQRFSSSELYCVFCCCFYFPTTTKSYLPDHHGQWPCPWLP